MFKIEEILSTEEIAIVNGISKGAKFDVDKASFTKAKLAHRECGNSIKGIVGKNPQYIKTLPKKVEGAKKENKK